MEKMGKGWKFVYYLLLSLGAIYHSVPLETAQQLN
jgi:hypothetical protein